MQPIGERAVVLGASMGGLLVARVLADAYERVTVVERDQLPPPGGQRRGVPQGRHAHGLLMRGHQAIEELFPGLTDELVARGAMQGDMQVTVRWCNDGLCLRQAPSDLLGLLVSRPLLEGHVRRRLLRVEVAPDKITVPEGSFQLPGMTTWLDRDLVPVRYQLESEISNNIEATG